MGNLASILQTLEKIDHWLFKIINGQWTNSFFDAILPFLREPNFWMPLYLFFFVFIAVNFKKNWWWWIVFFLCTVALTDMVGTKLFKHVFGRLRPCNDPDFTNYVRLLVKSCTGYSFISNHAANHFGMTTFFYVTLRNYLPKWIKIIWLWPITVSYAQVYVGLHYPFDVLTGALLGILFGLFTAMFFNKKFGFANFDRYQL